MMTYKRAIKSAWVGTKRGLEKVVQETSRGMIFQKVGIV